MPELTCPSCGKTVAEGTRFCPECGGRITPEPVAPLPPAPPAAIPPTVRLDVPPQQPTTPPGGFAPPLPAGALPPATGFAAPEAAAPKSRRTLWWILGGVGCLSVLLLGACLSIGALTLLGQQAANVEEAAATPVPSGGGGVVPEDSPLTGGSVLLEDDFSSEAASNLDVAEDDTSRSAYEDGVYVLEVKVPATVVWSLVGGPYEDVSLEVLAEVPAGSDVTAAGVVFHYQDNDNFYLFSVSNDGYYTLELLQNGSWTTLIDPTQSDLIDGTSNLLRVETRADQIALYVNGSLLEETVDGTFSAGELGLAVSTFENSTGRIHFDNLLVTRSE